MKNYAQFSLAASLLALVQGWCVAQTPDYSEATIEKLKPLNEIAQRALDAKDHPRAFEAYLKMWNLSHIPLCQSLAISNCWDCINFDRVERGLGQTEITSSMALRCPEPLDTRDEKLALDHLLYSMIQVALVTQDINVNHAFDSAAHRLAQSEAHLEVAKRLSPELVSQQMRDIHSKIFANARKTITHNKGVETYYKILGGVRSLLQSGQGSAMAKSAPANVSNTTPSGESGSDTKTYTVTSDARANQTGDEAGASGESTITVRGDDGTFTVRYWYNWPSSYLISAGRGKSLKGKTVRIQFDGEKASHISCDAGSGKCQIRSFSQQ